ncbi:tetratricopeptide repeat protein, partial [Crossiella sp. SN42]|uniref:tetratricopeptide repeat protein n=1 Tax=Crossiella sp. SN42 TaxID=2944808 RepID=UPI00207CD1C8
MTTPAGPAWQRWKQLHNEGAHRFAEGDVAGAARLMHEAHALTLAAPGDPEALARRAQTLINLASLTDGEPALELVNTAIELTHECEALVGDEFGTESLRATLFAVRAQTVVNTGDWRSALPDLRRALDLAPEDELAQQVLGHLLTWCHEYAHVLRHHARFAEARQLLDAAIEASTWFPLPQEGGLAALHTIRASVLAAAGEFAEAATDAATAQTLAETAAPQLIPNIHLALAEIADGTGDPATAAEHQHLARELFAALGESDGEAIALNSLGRLAHLAGRDEEALSHYTAAAGLGTDPWHRIASAFGQAAAQVTLGRPAEAVRLLAEVPTDSPRVRIGVLSVRGSACEAMAEFDRADESFAEARAACAEHGLWHLALNLAWWHADALLRRAKHAQAPHPPNPAPPAAPAADPAPSASHADRTAQPPPAAPLADRAPNPANHAARALDLALPAALAAE